MKIQILFLMVFLTSFSWGQKPIDYEKYLDEFSDKDYIFLEDHKTVRISIDKSGELEIYQDVTAKVLLTSDRAALYKSDKIYSSYFETIESIDAYALNVKNEKSFNKEKVKDFTKNKAISNDVFHDDIEVTNFEFSNLKKGSITSVNHTKKVKVPYLSNSLFLSSHAPRLSKSLTIIADNDVDIGVNLFNMDSTEVEFTKSIGKKQTTYTWKKTNIASTKRESKSPSPRYFSPHLITRIKGYYWNGEYVSILKTPDDLYAWYHSLVQETKCNDQEKMKEVLDEIISPEFSEEEKVKAVYYWVQDNIKYIAIEDGLGGLIPRDPDLVFSRKYGDCKDMATLIVEMLSILEVPAYQAWVGSRSIPYGYEELPSPAVDNHMIAVYFNKENEPIYLDATDNKLLYGMPSAFIQGKETMINLGDSFKILEIPVIPSSENSIVFNANLRIEDGVLLGQGEMNAKGYYANDLNHSHARMRDGKSEKNFIKGMTEKGNNKYKLIDYDFAIDRDEVNYNYSFTIENYVLSSEEELYINLNLDRLTGFFDAYEKDRKSPVEERFTSTTSYSFELEIPEGYEVDFLPPNFKESGEDYKITIDYEQNENAINYKFEIVLDYLIMEANQAQKLHEIGKKVRKAYNEQVVLKKASL